MTLSHHPPRPSPNPKLVSDQPTASAPASLRISHVQLRDLIVCPAERGVVWYVSENSIIEQDILSSTPELQRTLAILKFTPVTLSTLRLASSCPGGKDVILLAAGGQDAELFLALYTYTPRRTRAEKERPKPVEPLSFQQENEASHGQDISIDSVAYTDADVKVEDDGEIAGYSTSIWQHTSMLVGSINNNVLLYMPPPLPDLDFDDDDDPEQTILPSPRLVVSNNDCTVKFFDVCLARKGLRRSPLQRPQDRVIDTRYWRQDPGFSGTLEGEGWGEKGMERIVRYERVGCLRLPVPVNHTSISPDGSTVLSCGDTSMIYLHRILPVRDGSSLLFEPLATYNIPSPSPLPSLPFSSPLHGRRHSRGSPYSGHHDPGGAYLPFAFVNGSWVLAGPHPYLNDVTGVDIPPACFATAWSADGMRFAVASQEGVVRVWDVRSKDPLGCAGWETGPGGILAEAERAARENGTAPENVNLDVEVQRALNEFTGGAPPWGIRSLKFVRNASGQELLVFTEHVSRVHVVEANSFSRHDILRIPHVQSSASGSAIRGDTRLPSFRPVPSSAQLYAITPSELPRWMDSIGSDGTTYLNTLPRYLLDTSAVWRSSGDDGPSESDRGSVPRLASRLEARARARRLGLVPPRMNTPESREGTGRVLSPSVPLTRSPEPTALRTLVNSAVEEDTLSNDDYQSILSSRTPGAGRLSLAQRISNRNRARERERRELDQEQHELRRRSPASRLRDDIQMEEDIAYHAALDRARYDRERERHARTLARIEARRARALQLREREELEQNRFSTDVRDQESDLGTDDRGPVVIPPLASAQSEEDVRNVLAAHGIHSVRSTAEPEMEMDDSRSEQLLADSNPQDSNDPRPSSSSASTVSSTSFSEAGVSTRAQAGSVAGERQSGSTRTRFNSLLTPSIRDLHAAQDALRAIDEYRMEVDVDDGNDEDTSESTEPDCAEPAAVTVGQLGATGPAVTSNEPSGIVDASLSMSSSSVPNVVPSTPSSPTTSRSTPDPPQESSATSTPTQVSTQSHSLPPCRDLIESTDRLDIAGITFDPSGAYMYVATVDGITEWTVQGIEQRWWHSGGYI